MPEPDRLTILEDYIRPRRTRSRIGLGLFAIFLVAALAWLFKSSVLDVTVTPAALKGAVEVFDISSQWVVKDTYRYEDEEGIILVPEVSFRIRNRSDEPLKYLFFLGVFRFMDTGKTMGEGYQMALERPLPGNGESDRITLRSGFGYRASSRDAFKENPHNWRNAYCEVYIRSRNSELTFYKSYYISRRIEGMPVDVKI